MSPDTDRIPVPTNGHHPPLTAESTPGATGESSSVPDPIRSDTDIEVTARPSVEITVTPAQLAVGLGIVAGLILLVLGRRRGRRG
jgi:hypothetical protein